MYVQCVYVTRYQIRMIGCELLIIKYAAYSRVNLHCNLMIFTGSEHLKLVKIINR